MEPILLSRSRVDLDIEGRAIAIVAKGREGPRGVPVVELAGLLINPRRWLTGEPLTMVMVGLSHMMTPANRVKLGRVFHEDVPRPEVTRISIDDVLFLSEPWRMWWHFKAVRRAEPWGLTDSYLAETRWNAAVEMRTADPFAVESVLAACRGVVRAIDPFTFPPIDVVIVKAGAAAHAAYAREKEAAFTDEKTIGAIVRRLSAVAQDAVALRAVPSPSQFFRRPPTRIVRTDLAVDTFLVGQLLERAKLTNAIAEACS